MTLYGLLRGGLLNLPDDEAPIDELANVRLRETSPGQFRLDHDARRHDDRAVAIALATWGAAGGAAGAAGAVHHSLDDDLPVDLRAYLRSW
jgi:hypothetical protein